MFGWRRQSNDQVGIGALGIGRNWVRPVRNLGGSTPPTTGCAERLEYGNVLLNWGEWFLGPSFQPAQGGSFRLSLFSQASQLGQASQVSGQTPSARSEEEEVWGLSRIPRSLAVIPNRRGGRAPCQPKSDAARSWMERRYAAARKERSADPHFHMVPSGRVVGERAAIR